MFKQPLKRFLKSDAVRAAFCWLGARYIALVWATGRWRIENDAIARAYWERGEPFILAFWHGHILMMPKCWDMTKPMHMLISQHRDGQLIANTIAHFGLGTIAGSSSKGGSAALRAMLKALKAGEYVGITPDGPRGPRMRASDGIVQVARLSGAPILPCAFSCAPRKQLRSWDRFQVALPFARGVIRWGAPITVPREAEGEALEAARIAVEDAMTANAHAAEAAVGHAPTEPAAPGEVRPKRSAP